MEIKNLIAFISKIFIKQIIFFLFITHLAIFSRLLSWISLKLLVFYYNKILF